MSAEIYTSGGAINLGDPIALFQSLGEMAKAAGKDKGLESLFALPDYLEQDYDPEWFAEMSSQATEFEKKYAGKLSDHTRWLLAQLGGRPDVQLSAQPDRAVLESASPIVDRIIARGATAGLTISDEIRRKVKAAVKKKFGATRKDS